MFAQRGESSAQRSIKAKQTSPFLWKNRLVWHGLHLCSFPSVTPGFQTPFGHYVPPPQYKSVVRVKYRYIDDWRRSDFPAWPDCSSDIWPHLKCLVTVANWFDWRIVCLCFSTEASWSGGLFMTNSVKTTKGWGVSKHPCKHVSHRISIFGQAKAWAGFLCCLREEKKRIIHDNFSLRFWNCKMLCACSCLHLTPLKRKLDHTY